MEEPIAWVVITKCWDQPIVIDLNYLKVLRRSRKVPLTTLSRKPQGVGGVLLLFLLELIPREILKDLPLLLHPA